MKASGSIYVAVIFAILSGYCGYQLWLNPSRAVKRRLGEVAMALSAPQNESQMARAARLAQLRRYLAEKVRVRSASTGRELTSRDEALAAAAMWKPSQKKPRSVSRRWRILFSISWIQRVPLLSLAARFWA